MKSQKSLTYSKTDFKVAYRTTNNIQKHVQQKQHKNNSYDLSGVYRLKCKGCPLEYIGQTGRSFGIRYKEHVSAIKHNKDTSTYAQHTYGNIQDVMEIIQVTKKGRYSYMNSIERFHIFCTQKKNKHMNEVLFDLKNPIFETIYNHYT
jgi:hypothetical protein